MSHRQVSGFDALRAKALQLKAVLSKDYSLSDIKEMLSKIGKSNLKGSNSPLEITSAGAHHEAIISVKRLDVRHYFGSLQAALLHHRNVLLLILLIAAALMLHRFIFAPFEQTVQMQLAMRPAQWSQLQSLIKLSKSNTSTIPAMIAMAAPLDEIELPKVKNVLVARGLKPAVFRLTADNPPRIELQASEILFSVLLEALEELRVTWRLYPIGLNVVATSNPGVVNVSATLSQFGSSSASTGGVQ